MIQTQLLKLDPPYQIIACRGEVGIQIATLIVTEETRGEDGKYGITTHSHPVVSYSDKPRISKKMAEATDQEDLVYMAEAGEGIVWDKIECTDCSIVRFTDSPNREISSWDFGKIAGEMLEEIAFNGKWRGHRLMELKCKLEDVGINIKDDPEKEHHFTLELCEGYYSDYGQNVVINHDLESYPMPVPVMEPKEMFRWFKTLVRQYNLIFGKEHRFYFKSRYESPYDYDYLPDDFDPEHLTPEQKACNELVKMLNETDLYDGLH